MINMLINIYKIIIWLLILLITIEIFGAIYGILIYSLFTIIWNIIITLIIVYKYNNIKITINVLKIIFSTNLLLPFIIYGCYCSPQYGSDGKTKQLSPIDELDYHCRTHDETMIKLKNQLITKEINKKQQKKLKNIADWQLMKKMIYSNNYANGIYLLGLEIGFLFRIIFRTLF